MKAVPLYYFKAVPVTKPLPAYTTFSNYFNEFYFKLSGYNQYGLYHNDIMYEFPDVAEAIRRLPAEVYDARNFRIIRAIQLDIQRIRLPPEQWPTYEEDKTLGRYLLPYLLEVQKEMKERDSWDAEH